MTVGTSARQETTSPHAVPFIASEMPSASRRAFWEGSALAVSRKAPRKKKTVMARPRRGAAKATPSPLVDYDEAGRALGLEILSFDEATVARINEVLLSIGHAALPDQELAPLRAA